MTSDKPSLCLGLPVGEMPLVLRLNEEADLGVLPPLAPPGPGQTEKAERAEEMQRKTTKENWWGLGGKQKGALLGAQWT